jgi:ribulose-5-phosphate 4-epimerase/fuculose-1-phosphate aldolase
MRAQARGKLAAAQPRNPAYSAPEWEQRLDLAACYRLIRHYGYDDLIYNHVTARVPDQDDRYLINPYGHRYDEITASSLIRIDLAGRIHEDTSHEINPAGYVIHSAVHAARHDVACVLHVHSHYATLVSTLEEGFIPLTQAGFQFYDRVAYHDYEGFALDTEERWRLVVDLGQRNVLVLRNHGVLTCGRSVAEAFRRLYYFEQACRTQIDAMAAGTLRQPPPAVMEHTAQQWESGAAGIGGGTATREWPALLRMLDGIDPGWRS